MISSLPPWLILFVGAGLCAVVPQRVRRVVAILSALAAMAVVLWLPEGTREAISVAGFDLSLLRIDRMSRVFGVIFTLNAVLAFIYAWVVDNRLHHSSALAYMGCALGVVFSGDLYTLYFFWEGMAIASTFVLLSARTESSRGAAFRYVLVHLLGGLILLAGLVQYVHAVGDATFTRFPADGSAPGSWLILIGLLINAAAPPVSAWLSDAYPEASFTGGLILSAYTTKTAVYTLMRGFPQWDILIWIGCIMALYGIVYALLENDMRRILAFSIINQVGFMLTGIGIGTEMALNGAAAHAFCHILYKSLLWMSAGAVLYRTGRRKCTDLGGLYHTMPWTLAFGCIGALAISAVPFTSGFTSKTLILEAATETHKVIPWLVLECASAGVFLHAGIKFPYFVFFNGDRGLRPPEAPISMRIAMALGAALCIGLGCYPEPLYALLPFEVTYEPYSVAKVISQFQMLAFSGLVFFLFLPALKRTNTIVLDTDWFYRRGGPVLNRAVAWVLNGLNRFTWEAVRNGIMPLLYTIGTHAPAIAVNAIFWPFRDSRTGRTQQSATTVRVRRGLAPIGWTILMVVLFLLIAHLI